VYLHPDNKEHPDGKDKTAFSADPRAVTVHSHALWPLQCPSDISEINADSLKRPHYSCLAYLDDMIVIGHMFQEHLLNLWKLSSGSEKPA
jgi:hypothetical protein